MQATVVDPRYLSAIHGLLRESSSGLIEVINFNDLFHAIIISAKSLTSSSRCYLFLLDDHAKKLEMFHEKHSTRFTPVIYNMPNSRRPDQCGIVPWMAATATEICADSIDELQRLPSWNPEEDPQVFIQGGDLRSLLGVPLVFCGSAVGVLIVVRDNQSFLREPLQTRIRMFSGFYLGLP